MTVNTQTQTPIYPTLCDTIGNTPLIILQRIAELANCSPTNLNNNRILAKLEGTNPAGSVKDRPAFNMIHQAELAGIIKPGDTLIEATSGNTGIALAMVAAIKGYKLLLVMPDDLSAERAQTMRVYGAELLLTPAHLGGMEHARDVAVALQKQGKGIILDQFANRNNPMAHYHSTAQEIWQQSKNNITHFVSSMGTTGTITGCGEYFKTHHPHVRVVGVQPEAGAKIAGIRNWHPDYVPSILQAQYIDEICYVGQHAAEAMARKVAQVEGLFAGISAGGALCIALELAQRPDIHDATIVYICCDRGDRYLSTGIFAQTP